MTGPSSERPTGADEDSSASYIRGGAGTVRTSENAVRIATVALLVALLGLAITYAVHAHHVNARRDLLHDHGVPVTATVTSCVGTATGTGITVDNFTCRGAFTLHGHRYISVIGESTALLQPGQVVAAVADPSNPSVVSTATAAQHKRAEASSYDQAIVYVGAFLLVLIFALWWPRRGGRRSRGTDEQQYDANAPAAVEPRPTEVPTAEPVAVEPVAVADTGSSAVEVAVDGAPTAASEPLATEIPDRPAVSAPPTETAAQKPALYRRLVVPAAGLIVAAVVTTLVARRRRSR